MLLNSIYASQSFHKIKTIDSDVVLIAVGAFSKLLKVTELWIKFGTGKSMRYITIHKKIAAIGVINAEAFDISGCDTTSSVMVKTKNPSGKFGNSCQNILNYS